MPKRGRARRRLVACALVVGWAATACWGQVGGNAANQYASTDETRITPATVASLASVWSVPGVADIVWGNQVIGIDGGQIRSIAASSGAFQWAHTTSGGPFPNLTTVAGVAGPTVVGDEVWAAMRLQVFTAHGGACGGANVRVDLATGAELTPVVPATSGAIVPFGEAVAAYAQSFQFSPTSGCTSTAGPLTVHDQATGAARWTGQVGGRPVVIGDQLLSASGPTVRAYTAAGCGAPTCEPVWTATLPSGASQLSAAGAYAYALVPSSTPATLVALDRATGAVAWTATLPDMWPSMTLAGGRVHVVSDGTLSTFDAAGCGAPTCAPAWTANLGGPTEGPAISGGGVVYQGMTDGRVLAFDAAGCGATTCTPLATLTVAGTPSRLVVDGGRLFVTSTVNGVKTVTAYAPA